MHRYVCIWQYILQNYNYKLHFQNLSTYHILHVSIRTLAAKNLDVCIACDPWDNNIQLTMVKDQRSGPSMPFLNSDTCIKGGGYLFLPRSSSMHDAIHGWMTGRMDGWMEKVAQPWCPLLYVILRIKWQLWKLHNEYQMGVNHLCKGQTLQCWPQPRCKV
jgi:hypothetical protein